MQELNLYEFELRVNSIIVVKGSDMFRQQGDDGKIAFILNNSPRLIVNAIRVRVGDPVDILTACKQMKYSDMDTKYKPNYFTIPYEEKYSNNMLLQEMNREATFRLLDEITSLDEAHFKNELILPVLKVNKCSLLVLGSAFYYHKALTLLKRLSRTTLILACSAEQKFESLDSAFERKEVKIRIQNVPFSIQNVQDYSKTIEVVDLEERSTLGQESHDAKSLILRAPVDLTGFKHLNRLEICAPKAILDSK